MFGHTFGRKKCRAGPRVSSVKYSSISTRVSRHVKYVYDWWNPIFASCSITAGRVNASARNRTSGSLRRISASIHAQNGKGFVCGLSTRKMRTPRAIQLRVTSRHASHSVGQPVPAKSSGSTSSYRFGGFSAYLIDPSLRCANHSGCSVTQG